VEVLRVDPAVIVALIALAGTIGNVAFTTVYNARSEAKREMQRSDAQWARYRTSLGLASDELSVRLDNIVIAGLPGRDAYQDEFIESTLFRFAQYFGWSEIVRRYARSPDVRHEGETQGIKELQEDVARAFATDWSDSRGFVVWREAQRAIGELMITRDDDVLDVMGVAGFSAALTKLDPWLGRMRDTLVAGAQREWDAGDLEQLRAISHALKPLTARLPGR
jgi:hypothetical protein